MPATLYRLSAALLFSIGGLSAADAKPARCFVSDHGFYDCRFEFTDRNGSFVISAPGKRTYTLNIDEPGSAFGFVNFGTRDIFLPGKFVRTTECWINDTTGAKVCAQ